MGWMGGFTNLKTPPTTRKQSIVIGDIDYQRELCWQASKKFFVMTSGNICSYRVCIKREMPLKLKKKCIGSSDYCWICRFRGGNFSHKGILRDERIFLKIKGFEQK